MKNINLNIDNLGELLKWLQLARLFAKEGVDLWKEMKKVAEEKGLSDETRTMIESMNNESLEELIGKLGFTAPLPEENDIPE